ncbi:right-handed parallel beta-helix repeat-containing protein [Cellulomonas composti]|uniref:right-handed parallel beta-helix repeat-containing protein n=1 Tax=Cellulomonas composti TaxID=266130 RepID=UPI001C99652A|nr:right-handed parallel beta-helix repeat-containing protein [Cellulomonas composti]
MPRPRPLTSLLALGLAIGMACAGLVAACSSDPEPLALVRVPGDAETVTQAVARVSPGGTVLVGAGVYPEQVLVDKTDVTIRGEDRNATIIDGEGRRPYGIVAISDGVRIENLTVRAATFYGVLVTGLHDENGPSAHNGDGYDTLDPEQFPPVQRFSVDHVTAHNNGLYGIYAFDANNGVIRDSYASGSADSGFYVGQCEDCNILVTGNVAERNAVGFENANASGPLTIAGNRFSGNRVGMTLISNYREAFTPQRANTVVGNLVVDNVEPDSPAQATGGFGIGIGISGARENVLARNTVTGNPVAGVLLANTEDLAAVDNSFVDTGWAGNGIDLANVSASRAPASGNCVSTTNAAATPVTLLPAALTDPCPDGEQPAATATDLPPVEVPRGVSFLKVAAPAPQPDLGPWTGQAEPLPATVALPDPDTFDLPGPDFLAELTGTA